MIMKRLNQWYERNRNRYLLRVLKELLKNRLAIIGGSVVIIVIFLSIFTPYISPHNPYYMDFESRLQPPSLKYPFGTDLFGRDILSRIIWGSRASISVGIISVAIGLLGGILIGVVSGYWGGLIDHILMAIVDMLLGFPMILLALLIVAIMGPSLENLMIAVGIVFIPRFARVVRGSFLSIREMTYVEAAKAFGYSDAWIIFREILPNALAPVIVLATLNFAVAILTEGSLSFLGLGVQPPKASWGNMLYQANQFLTIAPWMSFFPGLVITIVVLAINLFGDGLRDATDPRLLIE